MTLCGNVRGMAGGGLSGSRARESNIRTSSTPDYRIEARAVRGKGRKASRAADSRRRESQRNSLDRGGMRKGEECTRVHPKRFPIRVAVQTPATFGRQTRWEEIKVELLPQRSNTAVTWLYGDGASSIRTAAFPHRFLLVYPHYRTRNPHT
jgi:hypothetical protein